jgi:hypothetical protein
MKTVLPVVVFLLTLPSVASLQELDDFAREMLEKERRELEIWKRKDERPLEQNGSRSPAERAAKATQATEPPGFGTIEWDSAPEALKGVFDAYEAKNDGRKRVFRAGYSIGEVPLIVDFSYIDNKLARVLLWFERRYLHAMSEAFTERYGKPSRKSGDIMAWSWKRVTVLIVGNNPSGNALASSASLTTAKYSQYLHQREGSKATAAAMREVNGDYGSKLFPAEVR